MIFRDSHQQDESIDGFKARTGAKMHATKDFLLASTQDLPDIMCAKRAHNINPVMYSFLPRKQEIIGIREEA